MFVLEAADRGPGSPGRRTERAEAGRKASWARERESGSNSAGYKAAHWKFKSGSKKGGRNRSGIKNTSSISARFCNFGLA